MLGLHTPRSPISATTFIMLNKPMASGAAPASDGLGVLQSASV